MASIANVRLSAKKSTGAGNNWDITVKYTAKFSEYEWKTANFKFKDGFMLWESDTFSDDRLTGVVSGSVFNPNAATVERTLTHHISGSTLNTEWGEEELYVVVRLQNIDLNLPLYTRKSGILDIDP